MFVFNFQNCTYNHFLFHSHFVITQIDFSITKTANQHMNYNTCWWWIAGGLMAFKARHIKKYIKRRFLLDMHPTTSLPTAYLHTFSLYQEFTFQRRRFMNDIDRYSVAITLHVPTRSDTEGEKDNNSSIVLQWSNRISQWRVIIYCISKINQTQRLMLPIAWPTDRPTDRRESLT